MSSSDDGASASRSRQPRRTLKKPRVARACDFCRRRKIRCDGGQGPGGKCASCAVVNRDCSYVQAGTEGPSGYLEALELRQERMEALLKRLHPHEDFSREIGIHLTRDNWTLDGALGNLDSSEPSPFASPPAATSPADATASTSPGSSTLATATGPHDPAYILDESLPVEGKEDMMANKLSQLDQSFKSMHIAAYLGKSANTQTYQFAMEIAEEGRMLRDQAVMHPRQIREKFWALLPWERLLYEVKLAAYDFPDPDLFPLLIDAYFENVNNLLPVLHRPTFEKEVRIGMHLHQEAFGAVVLLVCANGARFVKDRRVLLDMDDPDSWLSAGWKWFSQVNIARRSMISTHRLHDLQICCLGSTYLLSAARTSICYNLIGIGLRLAQEIGAHKKAVYHDTPTAEDELFKRAFWVLVYLDKWLCGALGRTAGITEEDIDVDLPTDCDDEYWVTTGLTDAFKQPPGKPSRMTYFILVLKLSRILGLILRIVYPSVKTRVIFKFSGPDWEQRTLASFDSVLNRWADSVPFYLQWDPTREDDGFFWQSAHLYASFYHLQILLHRSFIASKQSSSFSFPSLAICINASRSIGRLCGVAIERVPTRPCPRLVEHAMAAGIMLMLGIWGAKRSGMTIDPDKEMEDVHKCMRLASHNESYSHTAGRMWDVTYSLVTAVEMPLPRGPGPSRAKRPHEDDDIPDTNSSFAFSDTISSSAPPSKRPIAGSSRARASLGGSDATFQSLPTSTSDLGYMAMNDPMRNLDGNIMNLGFAATSAPVANVPDLMPTLDNPFQFGSHLTFSFGAGLELPFGTPGFGSSPGSGSQTSQHDSFEAMLQGFEEGTAGSAGTWSSTHLAQPALNEWDSLLSQLHGRSTQDPFPLQGVNL